MAKSLIIKHNEASINSNDNTFVTISEKGSVKIGTGEYLPDVSGDGVNLEDYAGVIRFNAEESKLQYCDGKQWNNFLVDSQSTEFPASKVWALLF